MDLYSKGVLTVTCILLFMVCSVYAAGQSADTTEVIKIGVIYNLEGSQAPLDVPSYQGALLAGDLFNEKNKEKQVLITLQDGKSDLTRMAPLTRDLIASSNSRVIIGLSDTDMVIPAAETAAAYNITFLTSGATSPKLPEIVPNYLYLACFGDNAQAAVAAEYAVHNLTAHSAAVYYDGSMNYTTLLGGYFKTRFEELGGEVIQYSGIQPGTGDLESSIKDLKEKSPDILFLAVGPDAAPGAVRVVRESGVEVPIFGGDSYDTNNLSVAANLSGGGVYYTTHAYFSGDDQTQEVDSFIKAYQEKYGMMPDGFAGLGYDAVNLVLKAMELAPGENDIRDGILGIHQYLGVTGLFSYSNSSPIPEKSVTLMKAGNVTPVWIGSFIPEKTPAP